MNDHRLDTSAIAIQLARVSGEKLILHEPMTFPDNPFQGTDQLFRQCKAIGGIAQMDTAYVLDVLNQDGEIIQDFSLTRIGFRFICRRLKCRMWNEYPGGGEG